MKRRLIVWVTILGILIILGIGGYFFYKAPDMQPIGTYFNWVPNWEDIKEKVPFLHRDYQKPPPLVDSVNQTLEQSRAQINAFQQVTLNKENLFLTQLKAAGIPVSGVHLVDSEKGEPVLLLDFTLQGISGNFMTSMVNSLLKVAENKDLKFAGLRYLTLGLRDSQDRVLFEVTARTADIDRFRSGQMTQKELLSASAAKIVSRRGVSDALAKGVIK
jgi:hypothetical protein